MIFYLFLDLDLYLFLCSYIFVLFSLIHSNSILFTSGPRCDVMTMMMKKFPIKLYYPLIIVYSILVFYYLSLNQYIKQFRNDETFIIDFFVLILVLLLLLLLL